MLFAWTAERKQKNEINPVQIYSKHKLCDKFPLWTINHINFKCVHHTHSVLVSVRLREERGINSAHTKGSFIWRKIFFRKQIFGKIFPRNFSRKSFSVIWLLRKKLWKMVKMINLKNVFLFWESFSWNHVIFKEIFLLQRTFYFPGTKQAQENVFQNFMVFLRAFVWLLENISRKVNKCWKMRKYFPKKHSFYGKQSPRHISLY